MVNAGRQAGRQAGGGRVVKKHFVTVFSETTDHSLFIFGIQH
jgi:hypothetical protein